MGHVLGNGLARPARLIVHHVCNPLLPQSIRCISDHKINIFGQQLLVCWAWQLPA